MQYQKDNKDQDNEAAAPAFGIGTRAQKRLIKKRNINAPRISSKIPIQPTSFHIFKRLYCALKHDMAMVIVTKKAFFIRRY